jgi:hypothetical protein
MLRKTLISLILILSFSTLIITNPSEEVFLRRIAQDYGSNHAATYFTTDMLKNMGVSKHESYYLFSTLTYEFGNVGVSYEGIGNQIFKIKSFTKEKSMSPPKPDALAMDANACAE